MQIVSPSLQPTVAVIIVNYGTAALAADAVRSVLRHSSEIYQTEVHLVDNASPDGDAAQLETMHSTEDWGTRVTLYAETQNLGFGRGNNVVLNMLGARATPPDFVLLLNPDAELCSGALETLVDFLTENKTVGCAGAQISKPQTGPVSAAFRFPTADVEFISATALGPLIRASGGKTLWMSPELETQRVDWVAGAAVMFRMEALQETGFFDPDFFLYFEEVELMWRLGQKGWSCWYVREAKVLHLEGAATDVRSGEGARKRRPAYWYQSQAMYFAKTASPLRAITRATARLAGTVLNLGVSKVLRRPIDVPASFIADYSRHTFMPLIFPTSKPANTTAQRPSQAQMDIDSIGDRSEAINDGTLNRNPDELGFWRLIREDFQTHDRDILAQGFWTLFWHRFGNWRMSVRSKILRMPLSLAYRIGAKASEWFCGMDLPYTVVVGRRVKLEHFGAMILIARAIGNDVTIRQNTTFGIASREHTTERPTIGDNVDIGVGSVIIGGIFIGRDCIIAAKSVVTSDFPAGSTLAGVPATIRKQRKVATEKV